MTECPYCKNSFTGPYNKKFCSYECAKRFKSIMTVKELFRLTPQELAVRKEYVKEMSRMRQDN